MHFFINFIEKCIKFSNFDKILSMEEVFENSIISDGKYELLFRSFDTFDEDGVETREKAIDWLNNARVKFGGQLKYSISRDIITQHITSINFVMPSDDDKLSEVFFELPYGIIKKNRTGVGATTLELQSKRNSIIVVPTRSLALNKAIRSKIDNTNKYRILYVAGNTPGIKVPSIEEYINDKEIEFKKFMVVIDSLPKLLNEIGEENFKNYFIMFDEVDTYQDSSWYREAIENSFDSYFRFPIKQRCLVSATLNSFSNPKLKEEPVINVEFNEPNPQNITLLHVNDPLGFTKRAIELINLSNPNDKIVIALNLLTRGILQIIESLPDNLKKECSVLCSDSNYKAAGEYYKELVDGKLPSKITFMTCIYFVGIDIEESFHLICTAWTRHPFTLLSVEKIQQIVGRCRVNNGILSETIIYNTEEESIKYSLPDIERQLIESANQLVELSRLLKISYSKFPTLNDGRNSIIDEDIVKASTKHYYRSDIINIVRVKDNQLLPVFFNIDNIIIQVQLRYQLYSKPTQLKDALESKGNNVKYQEIVSTSNQISEETSLEVEGRVIQTMEEEREELIKELSERDTLESRRNLALNLKSNCSRYNTLFLEHFIELQEFIPFEQLIRLLNVS